MMIFTGAVVLSTFLAAGPGQIAPKEQAAYASILAASVENGRVDYKGIEKNHLLRLDGYLKALSLASIPEAKDAKLAMLIDAYNALVLRAVITSGRPRSVLDVKGFFDQKKYIVAGKSLTLNELEKQWINPLDPRSHMALVCAAVGCPILEPKPYAGSNIDARLDVATRRYLDGPTGAVVERERVKLSKIFDWYQPDFGGPQGVLAFVRKHLSKEKAALLGPHPTVAFNDYNWTLNQQ